jgi:peptide/nickel transport system substrate-binding protein
VRHAREQAYLAWLILLEDIYGTSNRLVWEPRTDAKLLLKEMNVKN